MHAGPHAFHPDLRGLSAADWVHQFRAISAEHGFFEALGRHHLAGFVDAGDTLVVSFETLPKLTRATGGTPQGFGLCETFGWSSLTLVARGETWFRSPQVHGFFDNLVEDGFFAAFDRVLFLGSGSCGYAACTYARACPGAHVLAISPQATLDPAIAGWDRRHVRMRRLDFGGRYGFAPDGIAAAERATILFDPHETEDAMHAALFHRPNVQLLRTPFLGSAPDRELRRMRLMTPLVYAAATGALSRATFARMMRARRDNPAYLRRLLAALVHRGHVPLARVMARSVLTRREIPSLRRWLEEAG